MRQDDLSRPVAVIVEGLAGVGQGASLFLPVGHQQTLDLDAPKVTGDALVGAVAFLDGLVDVLS